MMKNGMSKSGGMRGKLLAVLLCGAVLAGCGTGEGLNPALSAGESVGLMNPEGAQEQPTQTQESKEEQGEMEAREEQAALERVETDGMCERAAYFADMVYQVGGSENTMVSPLSLDMALGLVAGGAQGKTKEELQAYLGREDYGSFAKAYMEFAEGLNYGDSEQADMGGYRMAYEIANSIWVKDDRKLVEDYVAKMQEQYQAEIASVSFAPAQAANTVSRINGWCKEKTHDLIPSVLSEDDISEDMAAILVNSLYFESPWAESWKLVPHTFTDLDGKESNQEMLTDTLGVYYENEYATAFSKPYMNGMEFVGILPKAEGEFSVQDLDLESLLKNGSTEYDVLAMMPKLNFETTANNVVGILRAQGVETVFDAAESDLSGLIQMGGGEVTYISDIIQKCKLELDEDGTRAAAVTMAMARFNSVKMPEVKEQKEVYLDRPFAFMIYDSENEQIVFIGKVVKAD
ncbi:MAG: hypothetical protein NC413_09135 [Muribaculum sp.]|nr:hypothetical protein [Muribaculum sp.]